MSQSSATYSVIDAPAWSLILDPDSELVEELRSRLAAYNVAHASIEDETRFGVFGRDSQGDLVAGLYARSWGRLLEIRMLWVHDNLRAKGIGRQLLLIAEQEARRRNCRQIVLDTFTFQAPEFYTKLGFETFGVVEGFPEGIKKYYMRKTLDTNEKNTI